MPEKNEGAPTKIKTVTAKKKAVEGGAKAVKTVKKEAANEKSSKRTKLPVRLVGSDLKIKNRKAEEVLEKIEAAETAFKEIVHKEAAHKESHHKEGHHKEAEHKDKKEGAKPAKDFYKKISKKIEEEGSEKGGKKEKERPIGLYRKIAVAFLLLTVSLLAVISYFYFVSLTVEVTPKKERISNKTTAVVYNATGTEVLGREYIKGAVEQIPVKEEKTFPSTGAEVLGKEIVGQVTLYNNQNRAQTLIATTRVMSSDGKVFRIKDKVDIPANGEKTVDIYSDEPSEEMAIKPTNFTLPALWAGLQDKVYAKSTEAFVYKTQLKKYVQQIDIDKAIQDLKGVLVDKVSSQIGTNYKGFNKVIFEIDKNSFETKPSAKVNEAAEQFTVSVSALVSVIAFNKADVEKLAQEKMLSSVPADKKMAELDANKIEYNLANTDFTSGRATIDASFVGSMVSNRPEKIVERSKLINLNEAQIRDYLRGQDSFSDFKLTFYPSFLKRAPSLVDKIKVIIR